MPLGLWKSNAERHRETMTLGAERHREVMATLAEQHRGVIEELIAVRKELTLTRIELTDAVNANTEAILRLIDRFDQWEGRPPGPPDLRSV
jgi:hypothetical protein